MAKRVCPMVLKDILVQPFASAEEVWFWFCRVMTAGYEGKSGEGIERTARPCEINDVYRVVKNLMAKNLLNMREYKIMAKYGKQNQPPDIRFGASHFEVVLWKRAMAILSEPLKQKNIIV